jgi:hypothetical protein
MASFNFSKTEKKKILFLSIAFIFLFIVGSLLSFSRWENVNFFGKVISLEPTKLVIADKKQGNREILLTSKTVVHQGRDTAQIQLGDMVMVITKELPDGRLEAEDIRIMQDKFNKLPSQSDYANPPEATN